MEWPRAIFIAGNVPSSKNGRVWTGKFFVVSSSCSRYIKQTKIAYKVNKEEFLDNWQGCPVKVGMYFVRDSRRRFDYINVCQIVADLMVKNGWLVDDDSSHFVPVFLGYEVNKQNAGVYLVPLDKESENEKMKIIENNIRQ